MKNKIVNLLIILLFLSGIVYGQKPIEKTIKFKKETRTEEIIIEVKENYSTLDLQITGTINLGKIKVDVVDPDGTTVRKFKVKVSAGDVDKERPFGKISKFLKEPQPGSWKIILTSTKAKGEIKIEADFKKNYYIKVPESFSPNGDGMCDLLKLETFNISEIDFRVYDRWGKLVFSTKDINEGWDGVYNGETQEKATYFYVVSAKTISGKEVTENGYTYLMLK